MNEKIFLKSNKPFNLMTDNDLFDIKPKADMILDFIRSNPDTLESNSIFVLYGEWGSGKTTVLDYLRNKLEGDFETVFFEAWKYEKDGNLPLSLLETICEKKKDDSKVKEAFESSYHVLKAFAKSVKFNFGLFSIDNKEFLDEIEKKEMQSDRSVYAKNKQFQKDFQQIEDGVIIKSCV